LALREEQGLTLRELSRRTGVPAGTLGYWSWRLQREASSGRSRGRASKGFVELIPDSEAGTAAGHVEIVLGGGRRVVIRGEVDESALRRVVRALDRC